VPGGPRGLQNRRRPVSRAEVGSIPTLSVAFCPCAASAVGRIPCGSPNRLGPQLSRFCPGLCGRGKRQTVWKGSCGPADDVDPAALQVHVPRPQHPHARRRAAAFEPCRVAVAAGAATGTIKELQFGGDPSRFSRAIGTCSNPCRRAQIFFFSEKGLGAVPGFGRTRLSPRVAFFAMTTVAFDGTFSRPDLCRPLCSTSSTYWLQENPQRGRGERTLARHPTANLVHCGLAI
jgi:hypothetical protein